MESRGLPPHPAAEDRAEAASEQRLCDLLEPGKKVTHQEFYDTAEQNPKMKDIGGRVTALLCQKCGGCALRDFRFKPAQQCEKNTASDPGAHLPEQRPASI